jgi:hypothetical protein
VAGKWEEYLPRALLLPPSHRRTHPAHLDTHPAHPSHSPFILDVSTASSADEDPELAADQSFPIQRLSLGSHILVVSAVSLCLGSAAKMDHRESGPDASTSLANVLNIEGG